MNDQRVESDETFTLNMVALSRNVELGGTSQAVLTIKNNDSAGVTLGAERVNINEETSGTYTVKLTLPASRLCADLRRERQRRAHPARSEFKVRTVTMSSRRERRALQMCPRPVNPGPEVRSGPP